MNYLIYLLAWRYIRGSREHAISTMILVCFAGIMVGSFALALILSIMNGFEQATHEKLQAIHPPITMHADHGSFNVEKVKQVIKTEFPEVIACSPNTMSQLIIQSGVDPEITTVAMLKGIDPIAEQQVTTLHKKIVEPKHAEFPSLGQSEIIIGKKLAQYCQVTLGDTVNLLYTDSTELTGSHLNLQKCSAQVTGIFSTGIEDFDNNLVFTSIPFFTQLFPEVGITHLNIRLAPYAHEEQVIQRLKQRFMIDVYTWKELYPALIAALKLEKYGMFFILTLIILVASMNIMSLLFMYIIQKRADIGILKAMGFSHHNVRRVFLTIGTAIAGTACISGLLLAWVAGMFLERYPFITLPDSYYVSHLPITMELHLFVLVCMVIMSISYLATVLAVRKIAPVQIASLLRMEI